MTIGFRADCHVHLGPIGGPHTEAPPSPAELQSYASSEGLAWIFGIYESEASLEEFRRNVSARIFGFFWSRRPDRESVPEAADGLKLHPYLDGYTLERENVEVALESAVLRDLPVLIHADDRTPDVSRPALVGRLAEAYPEARFIVAHAGSYAPPEGSPFRVEPSRVGELVGEAIEVGGSRENIWLETSVLASPVKARILAERCGPERLLFGSDYPILKESQGSIRKQEEALIRLGWSEAMIRRVHENARDVISTAAESVPSPRGAR